MKQVSAFIGLGANLGNARETVKAALRALAALPGTRLLTQSSLFKSAPVDASGDDYVNAVAQIETILTADQLLENLLEIEQMHGRQRPGYNAPRTLDLDLLLYGQEQIGTASLVVPHPRMTQRAFVLLPLLQIAPQIAIPGKGLAHGFVPDVAGQAISILPEGAPCRRQQ